MLAPLAALLWVLRVAIVCRRRHAARPAGAPPVKTMVVLGSGGHTAEMMALLRKLNRGTFAPLLYVIARSDHTSAQRIEAFERECAPGGATHRLLRLPRSREVGQSYFTSVFTTLRALVHATYLVYRHRPSVVLCNGPGTCIPICAAAWSVRRSHHACTARATP